MVMCALYVPCSQRKSSEFLKWLSIRWIFHPIHYTSIPQRWLSAWILHFIAVHQPVCEEWSLILPGMLNLFIMFKYHLKIVCYHCWYVVYQNSYKFLKALSCDMTFVDSVTDKDQELYWNMSFGIWIAIYMSAVNLCMM